MPNDLAKLLFDDLDDNPAEPHTCLPTRLITLDQIQPVQPLDLNEEYYRRLSDALDEALNL